MITFTKAKLPYGWLGNMSPFQIIAEAKLWLTAEAYFQSLRFNDDVIREEIRAEKSPMGAKFKAKKHLGSMVIEPASVQDVSNMEGVLRLKLQQYPELRNLLKETGDQLIVEDVTNRANGRNLFWGMANKGEQWVGQNILGNLWMKLRGELNA